MNFSKWALDNSKLINFMVVILVVGGLMAYNSMSKLEDPAIKVKQAMVITTYPGASAHQVELEVIQQLLLAVLALVLIVAMVVELEVVIMVVELV